MGPSCSPLHLGVPVLWDNLTRKASQPWTWPSVSVSFMSVKVKLSRACALGVSLGIPLPQSPPETPLPPSRFTAHKRPSPHAGHTPCLSSLESVCSLRLTEQPPFFSTSFTDSTFVFCGPYVEPRRHQTSPPGRQLPPRGRRRRAPCQAF